MKFVVLGIVLAVMAGVLHMGFIMFDYAFFDADDGGFTKMMDTLNQSMTPQFQNSTYNQSVMLRNGFGYGRIICITLCPLMFLIEAYTRKTNPVQ